ncbi:hypothetical protein ZHAS_00021771 [Anopheles sinensis]|uniref:Uncharacterized protein n=1 Tax=Anopheles sinensis TaxID=74873 RepID=A0A084WTJ7_ANOSI|nr:hypothetical protein ZHAS_00021771 [Anopheles sinensis]
MATTTVARTLLITQLTFPIAVSGRAARHLLDKFGLDHGNTFDAVTQLDGWFGIFLRQLSNANYGLVLPTAAAKRSAAHKCEPIERSGKPRSRQRWNIQRRLRNTTGTFLHGLANRYICSVTHQRDLWDYTAVSSTEEANARDSL